MPLSTQEPPRSVREPTPPPSSPVSHLPDSDKDAAAPEPASGIANRPKPSNDKSSNPPRFSPSEEASLLASSDELKSLANATFTKGDYSSAITHYERALGSCPTYLDYEVAVLRSNIAACHLKLEDWKAAIEATTSALEGLERLVPSPKHGKKEKKKGEDGEAEAVAEGVEEVASGTEGEDGVVELEGDEEEVGAALEKLQLSDGRKADVLRIRAKSLLRRARARSQLSSWSELQGAEDDYRLLSTMDLPPGDRRVVQQALRELPGRVKEARDREVGEMMGKLKELGNGLLKPFGLSTDMFKMQQGEDGGYSLSMNSGGGK